MAQKLVLVTLLAFFASFATVLSAPSDIYRDTDGLREDSASFAENETSTTTTTLDPSTTTIDSVSTTTPPAEVETTTPTTLADQSTTSTIVAAQTTTPPTVAAQTTTTVKTTTAKTTAPPKTTTVKATTTKKPKPLDCGKAKFQNMDNCCKVPVGNIFPAEAFQGCTKDKKLMSWMNDFNLNLLQNAKMNNSANLNSTNIIKILCSAAPVAACVYNNSKLLGTNNALNASEMTTFLAKGRPAEWKSFAEEMASLSTEDILSMLPPAAVNFTCPSKKKTNPPIPTNLVPLIHAQLIQAEAIIACPGAASPVVKKDNCVDNGVNFGKCLAALAAEYNGQPGINFSN